MNRKRNPSILFMIVSAISAAFIFIPLILRIEFVYNAVSWFLSPLGEYGSSYIETLGAILGTFLAVTGALWTQRKIDEVQDKKELRESALIVYYDFEFAFKDIIRFMLHYLLHQDTICNFLNDFEEFKSQKEKSHIYIYIDDNWIHNVAKLSYVLSSDEIQCIYKLYGDLNTIRRAFNSPVNGITEDDAKSAYSVMYKDFCKIECSLTYQTPPEVTLKEDVQSILNKLRDLGKVE